MGARLFSGSSEAGAGFLLAVDSGVGAPSGVSITVSVAGASLACSLDGCFAEDSDVEPVATADVSGSAELAFSVEAARSSRKNKARNKQKDSLRVVCNMAEREETSLGATVDNRSNSFMPCG